MLVATYKFEWGGQQASVPSIVILFEDSKSIGVLSTHICHDMVWLLLTCYQIGYQANFVVLCNVRRASGVMGPPQGSQ